MHDDPNIDPYFGASNDGKILSINARYFPAPSGVQIPTLAVLVSGAIGDYAVYVGHGTPEWVARHGDKISFEEAAAQFMGLDKRRYRP